MDEQQSQLLYEVFSRFDREKEGYLNEMELRNLLAEFEIDQSFAPSMLRIFSGSSKRRSSSDDYSSSSSNNDQIESSSSDSNSSDSSNNNHQYYASFEDIIEFFKIIISGDAQQFYQMLFLAIDSNNDNRINKYDLVEFSRLFGEEISIEEAGRIIKDCVPDTNGSIEFNNFWQLCGQPGSVNRNNSFDDLKMNQFEEPVVVD